MPQPVSNTTTIVSGSLLANKISYVVDGQGRNYRGNFGGLSWMSEVQAENNVIFIGNSTTIGRGPADSPLFYPSFNNTEANIIFAVNKLPGSPGNLGTLSAAYDWATTNNFFINNSDNPIPRIDADGLVLYLSAFLPTSYPQTGTTWYDLSGYGNNATLYNGLNSNWNSNGWFSFDGVDDYAYINYDSTSMAAWTGSQTIIFWEYHTFNDGSRRNFWNQAYGGAGTWTHEGGYNINYFYGNSGVDNVPYTSLNSTSTPTGKWNMLTTTRDPSQVNWYINNTNTSNMSNPYGVLTLTTNGITIGNGYTGTPWVGNMGAIAAYNKALTQAEINQVYFQGNIITDGLVFMTDASNLVSYPKSGTTTYSLTGSATGSLTNGVGFSSDNGGSWVFDGVDDYISLSPSSIPTGNEISISFWNNGDSFASSTIIAASLNNSDQTLNIHLPWSNKNIYWDCGYPFNRIQKLATDAEILGWHNWVFTKNATTGNMSIYLDGVEWHSGSGLTSSIPSMTVATLGSYFTPQLYHNGQIAQCLIHNKALTADEVQQNYEATKYKFQGQEIVTNGLVVYLDAADKDSYPGTGTSWDDLTGNENNGTLVNGPSFLSNQNGGIFDFDGADDYVSLGNVFNYTSEPFSFGYWVNFDSFSTNAPGQGPIIFYKGGYNTNGYYIQHSASTFSFITNQSGANQATSGTGVNTIGVWYYVVITRNGTSVRTYVNGVDTTSTAGSHTNPASSSNNFTLARYATSIYFNGKISNFVGYNRTLSATEVAQNFNAQRTRFGV